MPASTSTIAAKDGAGATIAGGLIAQDKSGAGTGPFAAAHVIVDAQGVNIGTVKAASTAVVAGDTAVAVGLHPTSPLPAGTNVIGTVRNLGNAGGVMDFAGQNAAAPASAMLIGGEFNTTPTTITTGNASPLQLDNAGNLLVNIKAGAGSGGTAIADEAAFTEGTTSFTPIGGVFKTSQTALTTGQAGAVALSAAREMNTLGKVWDGTNTAAVKAASTAPVAGDAALVVAISPNSVNANGQAAMAASAPVTLSTDQKYQTGMSPKGFAAAFTTLTRPANTTAYTAGNSISNSTTAGSVTALSATVSDTNNDPVTLTDILLSTSDTGAAGKRIRAHVFNSDPTASTGVVNGDGAAYSNKRAGYIGSFSGVLETGFSDGSVGRLVPTFNDGAASPTPNAPAGGLVVAMPTSGAKTLFIQFQAVDGFTPLSASTWIATARGFQGRAA